MDFSFQLYSGRKFPPASALVRRVAGYGYTQVEGFGALYDDAAGLAATLRDYGVTMPTGHFGLDMLKDRDTTLKVAAALGVRTIICPFVPPEQRASDDAGWVRLGETLAALGETYRKAGLGFGWHNHDFEFKPTPSGRLPMDILLETAPNNDWEVDVAWLVKGGQDPEAWFKTYGPRITAIHVKDLAKPSENASEDGWADVGHGRLDWQRLYTSIKASTAAQYFVMEHDNPTDVDRFAQRSIASARAWK